MILAFHDRIVAALIEAVRAEVQATMIPALQAHVEENMEQGTRPFSARNEGTKLYKGSGKLSRGFVRGKPGNVFKATIGETRSTIEYGVDAGVIPYAHIQEEGGVIPITPKMRRFFWAMYYKYGADMWKYLALTKKAVITIPQRAYLAPAVEAFEREDFSIILENIIRRVGKAS